METVNEARSAIQEEQKQVRDLVLAGLEQVKKGQTKDFNKVCNRLVEKYQNAIV